MLASAVLALASLRFYLTAAEELTASPAWRTAAAVAGLVLAVTALYAGLAFELEDSAHLNVLPTFRRHEAEVAMTGDTPANSAASSTKPAYAGRYDHCPGLRPRQPPVRWARAVACLRQPGSRVAGKAAGGRTVMTGRGT